MSDISRVLWECQDNTRKIEALTKEVGELRTLVQECQLRHQDDQSTIAHITRILDRVVATVDLSAGLLENRVTHIEEGLVDSEAKKED